MRRIQSLPISTAIPTLYCLLGIRPLEQELYLRSLTLLANVLYTVGTLEQDIAMRQVNVNDPDSHSWFVACNKRLHKYSLSNIYTVKQLFSSETQFKQQVKSSIDSYVKDFWLSLSAERKTLCFLNVETCQVGNVHPYWKSVENTMTDVRRAVVESAAVDRYITSRQTRPSFTGVVQQTYVCSVLQRLKIGSISLPHV